MRFLLSEVSKPSSITAQPMPQLAAALAELSGAIETAEAHLKERERRVVVIQATEQSSSWIKRWLKTTTVVVRLLRTSK